MPPQPQPQERWLTRLEAAYFLALALGWYLETSVMHRRGEGRVETSKRQPPVRLGTKILAHLRRWKSMDDAARSKASREAGEQVSAFLQIVAYDGQPIIKLRRSWSNARMHAWLDDRVTPHILRHTRATWMMQKGVDLWEASGALGMSVKTLTDIYGHHHPDWQRDAAEV